MPQQLSIDKYVDAIKVLEEMVQKVVPIKKTSFIEDHQIDGRFFQVLEEMGVIEVLDSSKLGGYISDWKYTKPSNATTAHLATRVTGAIYDLNRKAYEYYSSPEYKLKKAKKEQKEKEKAERLRLQEEKRQNQLKVQTKDTETIVMEISPNIQGQNGINTPPPIETVPIHNQVTYSLSGSLTRAELLAKLLVIVEDQPISSFEVRVTY